MSHYHQDDKKLYEDLHLKSFRDRCYGNLSYLYKIFARKIKPATNHSYVEQLHLYFTHLLEKNCKHCFGDIINPFGNWNFEVKTASYIYIYIYCTVSNIQINAKLCWNILISLPNGQEKILRNSKTFFKRNLQIKFFHFFFLFHYNWYP